jgi:signal transduction histidine kinase
LAYVVRFILYRFFRAYKSRQRMYCIAWGVGLGMAKAFVLAHGGTIAVASQPQAGTTFTITLPAAASQDEIGKPPVREHEMIGT